MRGRPQLAWRIPLFVGGGVLLLVAGVLFLGVLISGAVKPPPPNARCPACMTPCYIRGAERMTVAQQGAIQHRCPTCGSYEAVLVYRALAGFAPGRLGGMNELQEMQNLAPEDLIIKGKGSAPPPGAPVHGGQPLFLPERPPARPPGAD